MQPAASSGSISTPGPGTKAPLPHFYYNLSPAILNLPDHDAIEQYAAGAPRLKQEIAGLTPAQLDATPIPGTWTVRQIVLHLADADLISAYRMKRIIAEPHPQLDVWDENAFVRELFYPQTDAAAAAELFRLNREWMAGILRRLPVGAMQRTARHPEVGELALGQLVRLYVHHLEHHLQFLRKKRAMLLEESA